MMDIHPNFQANVKAFLKYFRRKIKDYDDILTGNIIMQERTKGIGILSKEDAISYGVTGPSGRASGFACDVRKHHPYGVYDKADFQEILGTEGDTFTR